RPSIDPQEIPERAKAIWASTTLRTGRGNNSGPGEFVPGFVPESMAPEGAFDSATTETLEASPVGAFRASRFVELAAESRFVWMPVRAPGPGDGPSFSAGFFGLCKGHRFHR
ncbi:MAG TPA: hypothetical protein VHI52_11335, partial [Verrucomicrobiae bacterium]|nr:hypothetical protein [Verrucomicrobiae bacterium]